MKWELIPEVFFDVIGRVVPGALLLLGVVLIYQGPSTSLEALTRGLPEASTESVLVFALVGYFMSVLLEQFWTFSKRVEEDERFRGSDPFLGIRERMPVEGARLLKLQAEKNLCEVLIPGLVILAVANAWTIVSELGPGTRNERALLLGLMVVAATAFWRWRASLQKRYDNDLRGLHETLETSSSHDPVPATGPDTQTTQVGSPAPR
jgi:membrane protein implicated in regulation of membrane protease activity